MFRIFCKLLSILILMYHKTFAYEAHDYPGNFCKRLKNQCCEGRADTCSVSISTTVCYCDQFCDRGSIINDCCPDYKEVCLEHESVPIKSCLNKKTNQNYTKDTGPIKDNCNECTCDAAGTELCDQHKCLIEDDLIFNISRLSPTIGWTAENYTKFWGRKFVEGLDLLLGTISPNFTHSKRQRNNLSEPLPTYFNSIETWPGKIIPIRDQEWCGTSWAISASSVASDRFRIQSNGSINVDLAPQHLVSCLRGGCHRAGKAGHHIYAAWNYINKTGLVEEKCFPYVASKQVCKSQDELNREGCHRLYKMTKPSLLRNDETNVMYEIKKYGPVQATMRIYQDFFVYKSGIYKHSALSDNEMFGFHAVRIIGWGAEQVGHGGIKYWIVANSWGTWWGEDGFFRIQRGSDECEIENYVVTAKPMLA